MIENIFYRVLGEAWLCLKGELENRQQTHQEAGLFFTQHAEETRRFCRDLTSRRDSVSGMVPEKRKKKKIKVLLLAFLALNSFTHAIPHVMAIFDI